MLQVLINMASSFTMAAFDVPDYFELPYICTSVFFFGEPEYPSDAE